MSLVCAAKARFIPISNSVKDTLKMQNFVNRLLRGINTFSSADAGGGFIADLTTCTLVQLIAENKKRSSLTCLMSKKWVLVGKRQK